MKSAEECPTTERYSAESSRRPSNDHTDSLGEIPHLQLNWNAKKKKSCSTCVRMTGTIFQPPIFASVPVGAMLSDGGWGRPRAIPNSWSLGWEFGIYGWNNPSEFPSQRISILVLWSGSYLKEIYIWA